jgi:tRNA uridine 5-carboxymethylaminomethyl modification enzyme
MLTARAEYRLRLRADNAAKRLTEFAAAAGAVGAARRAHHAVQREAAVEAQALLARVCGSADLIRAGAAIVDDGARRTLFDWLRFPAVDLAVVANIAPALAAADRMVVDEIVTDARYAPYLARQAQEVARLIEDERVAVPATLDYARVAGLSTEMVERLERARPTTLGAAARVRGVTPAALAAILVHSRREAA